MSTTHALVPLAAALAFTNPPVPWRLLVAASFAAAAPDLDGVVAHFWHIAPLSIYSHRGAMHSLFVSLAAGVIAAIFHRRLAVRPLVAGAVVAAAMASHGLLDMMTSSGRPVAYLWPISSQRLFADWRPFVSGAVHPAHLFSQGWSRLRLDLRQLVVPMCVLAVFARIAQMPLNRKRQN